VDESKEAAPEQPGEPEEAQGEEKQEEQQGQEEQAIPLDVYALLNYSVALMRDFAWQAMGLVPNAGTGKIERHLDQAQIAIDTASFLCDKLEPSLPEGEQAKLRAMVRDLKINFVQQRAQGE